VTVFAIVRAPEEGWGSAETLLALAGGVGLLAIFVALQASIREPLMRLSIFRTPNLAAANLAQFLLGAVWIPMWFFLNLYLQQVLGYGAFEGGAALLPMTVAIMFLMVVVAPRVIARLGFKTPIVAGMLVLADRYVYTAFARDAVRGVSHTWIRKMYNFAIRPDMAFYFKVPIEVAIDRLLGGTRAQLKYYEAGMDMALSADVTESFRIFQSRILDEYDKIVLEFGLTTMDATKEIEEQQEEMRGLVGKALENYRPKRGTHGKRATLFWRRFAVPKTEGSQA
jgi:thymidylate kinase